MFKGNEAKLLDKPVGAYCEDFQPPHHRRDGVPSPRTINLSPIEEHDHKLVSATGTKKTIKDMTLPKIYAKVPPMKMKKVDMEKIYSVKERA